MRKMFSFQPTRGEGREKRQIAFWACMGGSETRVKPCRFFCPAPPRSLEDVSPLAARADLGGGWKVTSRQMPPPDEGRKERFRGLGSVRMRRGGIREDAGDSFLGGGGDGGEEGEISRQAERGGGERRRRRRSRTSIRLSVNDKFFGARIGGGGGRRRRRRHSARQPGKCRRAGFPRKEREGKREKTGKSCSSPCLRGRWQKRGDKGTRGGRGGRLTFSATLLRRPCL